MTREIILSTCREIIYQYGLQHLLIDEVASRCGTSKKTIYELFGSKESLMECLGSTFLEQEKATFTAGFHQTISLHDKIQYIINYLFNLCELLPVGEVDYLKKKYKINHQMLLQYLQEVNATLESLLAKGQQQGEVYPDLDISTHTKLLLSQLQYLHTNYRQLMLTYSQEHWRRHVLTSFFRSTLINPY